jgi:hypothetical protein
MKQLLRVNEDTCTVRILFVTPCCGASQYDFSPEEPRQCFLCGKDWSKEPVEVEREKDLSHLRFRAVCRYVS